MELNSTIHPASADRSEGVAWGRGGGGGGGGGAQKSKKIIPNQKKTSRERAKNTPRKYWFLSVIFATL